MMFPARDLMRVSLVIAVLAGCAPGPSGSPADRAAIESVALSTERSIPGLRRSVEVLVTEGGIPHIYAQNERDLRRVQGYLLARDRYFSLEAGRRLGLGELSSLLGDVVLESDQLSRGQGMRTVGDRVFSRLTRDQLRVLEDFCAGANAFIDDALGGSAELPTEIRLATLLLGRSAEELMPHLTPRDLVGFATVIIYQQGFETSDLERGLVEDELATAFETSPNAALRSQGFLADIWHQVAPSRSVTTTTGFGLSAPDGVATGDASEPLFDRTRPRAGRLGPYAPGRAAPLPTDLSTRLRARVRRMRTLLSLGDKGERGSNEWAVSGRATRDGRTLLMGDGHLPLGIPAIFYQLGLDTKVLGQDDGFHQFGMVFAGVPWMGPGTNGQTAWTITYLNGDLTDWYREELELDDEGRPVASMFRGEARLLVRRSETYDVADIPALESVGRTEVVDRYETFDGRLLASIEGTPTTQDATVPPGKAMVNVLGDWVIPEDTNGDGIISAVSFDFSGFDVGDTLGALQAFGEAESALSFREASRRLVGFGQNVMAADVDGHIFYNGGYSATPCRTNLARDGEHGFADGADPRALLDGTQYGGFEVVLGEDGLPDEMRGEAEPSQCLIPFSAWPMAYDPPSGFLANANNDPSGVALDGVLGNDDWYYGGSFSLGYRAETIDGELSRLIDSASVDLDAMRALQSDHRLPYALHIGPLFIEALTRAKALVTAGADPVEPTDARLKVLYEGDVSRFDEVASRLTTWLAEGAIADSGVETFYSSFADESEASVHRQRAVATMIWNAWLREMVASVFDDEGISSALDTDSTFMRLGALGRFLEGRGEGNPLGLASFDPGTGESVFFDDIGTPDVVERSDELLVASLGRALQALSGAPIEPGLGGFGSNDMDTWLWGLRHLVEFEPLLSSFGGDLGAVGALLNSFAISTDRLPLAEDLSDTDPRTGLPFFPRPGGRFSVDVGAPSLTSGDYFYRHGPVMRMGVSLSRDATGGVDVEGYNILPGGQSGLTDSPHFDDQAQLWLGNRVLPLHFDLSDVVEASTERQRFIP